jgi:hypothetical protein
VDITYENIRVVVFNTPAKRGAHVTSIRMSNNCYVISWSWSYDNWIYNYLCNQCLSSLTLGVRITNVGSSNPAQARCTRYNSMWLSLSVTCDMSDVFPVSSTNNTGIGSCKSNYHKITTTRLHNSYLTFL